MKNRTQIKRKSCRLENKRRNAIVLTVLILLFAHGYSISQAEKDMRRSGLKHVFDSLVELPVESYILSNHESDLPESLTPAVGTKKAADGDVKVKTGDMTLSVQEKKIEYSDRKKATRNTASGYDSSHEQAVDVLSDVLNSELKPGQNYYTFRAHGKQINVWVWIPQPFSMNMPLSVHFPGRSAYSNSKYDITRSSLPALIAKEIIKPNAIVIVPQPPRAQKGYEDVILSAIEDCVQKACADRSKITLSGWSFGSVLGYDLLGINPKLFCSAIMVSGRINSTPKVPTFERLIAAKNDLPPIIAYHGTNDISVNTYEICETQINDLKRNGLNIELVSLIGSGHGIWGDPEKSMETPAVFLDASVLKMLYLES